MLRLSAHHRRMDCLFPLVGMRIGLQGRPESPFTCSYIWSSLDQYLSTYSSVCVPVIPCALFAVMCGDPDGARREAQLPDYTPSGPPLSVPV